MDHAGGIATHASTRDLYGLPPATYVVPRTNLADFEALFEVWRRLDRSAIPGSFVGLDPGEELSLGTDRFATPFRAHHRIYCQGYALGRRKRKLRAEHQGRAPRELERLRLDGVEITEPVETIEVAFCGDTTVEVLDQPLVQRARLLLLECTFVGDDVPPAKAHGKGHIHLADLAVRADQLQNEHILLTHFSTRYSPAAIRAALDRSLPPELRSRVSALTDHPRLPG
jgi:ribonuclease Z